MANQREKVGGIDDQVWSESESVSTKRPDRRRIAVVGLLLVLVAIPVLYTGAATALSRKDYGTFAFWNLPRRIDYCGRRYYPAGAQLGNARQFSYQDGGRIGSWTLTSRTFSLRPIFAVVDKSRRFTLCTTFMYVPLGGQKWETYVLSGGP